MTTGSISGRAVIWAALVCGGCANDLPDPGLLQRVDGAMPRDLVAVPSDLFPAGDGAGQVLRFTAEADSYVDESAPSDNFGAEDRLRVDLKPEQQTYLLFRPTGLSAPPIAVLLQFHISNGSDEGPAVYRTDAAWEEMSLTWDNRPPPQGAALANTAILVDETIATVELPTDAVGGDGPLSLVLVPTSSDGLDLRSREDSPRPTLIVVLGR